MPMLKNVTGLDLGSDSLKAVEFKQALRGLEPGQMRIHPRASTEIDLGEQVQHFLHQHEFSTEYITAAIPGRLLSNRLLEFPFRDRKKLTQAVPFQIEGDIPFEMEDVLVEWQTIGGDRNHALIIASVAQRQHVAALLEDLGEGSSAPRVIESSGTVLANLAGLFELDGSRVLLDLGHSQTTICLIRDGQPIGARTVPVGGQAITLAMARDRGLDPADAERLKCEQGIFDSGFESPYPNALAILDRIAREILRSVEASSANAVEPVSPSMFEITLMGGGAHLKKVGDYLSERTGISANPLTAPTEGDEADLLAGGDPVLFGPAIALALRGTSRSVTKCNFRKEDFALTVPNRGDLSEITRINKRQQQTVFNFFRAGWAKHIVLHYGETRIQRFVLSQLIDPFLNKVHINRWRISKQQNYHFWIFSQIGIYRLKCMRKNILCQCVWCR